jgi:hypothetical protein
VSTSNPYLQQYAYGYGPDAITTPADDPFLSVTQLQDPALLEFHVAKVSGQIVSGAATNGFSQAGRVDLTPMIVDVIIETTVVGASTLEVHLADPSWTLLQRDAAGDSFIDVAEDGWLLPIDVEFPHGSACWWRLCAAGVTLDLTAANLVLTFESRATSRMRELLGPMQSFQGELLSTFIERRVRDANGQDQDPGPGDNTIVFVNLTTPPPPDVINDGSPVYSPAPNRHSAGGTAQSTVASASTIADQLSKFNQGLLEELLRGNGPAPPPSAQYNGQPPAGPQGNTGSTQFNGQ